MSIPTGQFSHANLEYIRVGSAVAPGADYVLQQQAAVVASVATGQVLNILLPDISKSPFGPSIYFLRWNGLGTLTFAVVAGSPDVIRPAGATSYAETSPANAIDFLILATDGVYRIIAIHESGTSGGVNATAPNVQVVANAMDTGHEMGDTTLFLAPTIGGASKPATMGASSVCLADAGGLAIGAGSVSVGILGNDVEANGVVCGSSNGLVQSGACVLGHATGTLGDGEIFLGSGEATGTAGAITLCDVAPEVANTQANGDDYDFLAVNVNGNARYIPLTHTTALNGQNDGLNLICMGENVCGGVSGRAKTQLAAATDQSLVIGEEACGSWNATSTSTAGGIIVLGEDALKNTIAAGGYFQITAIGTRCLAGLLGTQAIAGTTCIGFECHQDYQPSGDNLILGHLNNRTRPTNGFDSVSVKLGRGIQQLATGTGGSRQVLVGANIMESATCTFTESNSSVMVGYNICGTASGQLSFDNVFIGRCLPTPVLGAAHVRQNTIIGGGTLTGAAASLNCTTTVCIGGASLTGAGAGLGSDGVVIGAVAFSANVAPLNANLTCLGARQTGVPNTSEVMIGKSCAAAGVTGRLSFGNAMEAVAAAATAGAAVLPAAPVAFIPISWNGVNYKIPVYNP